MNNDAMQDELLSPVGLRADLISHGLLGVEITLEEFFLAEKYGSAYPRLSIYDRIALAIAKNRHITLLTGDGALRNSATVENVSVIGTLGILDQLLEGNLIEPKEFEYCIHELQRHNGHEVRLPKNELTLRLQRTRK